MSKINISLSKNLRQELDQLIAEGEVTTIAQIVRSALRDYLRRNKLEKWDRENFNELEAGLLKKDPATGVFISRRFQRDLNQICEEKEGGRRLVKLVFEKLVGGEPFLKKYDFKIHELDLEGYYLAKFADLELAFRRDQKKVIVCRLGYHIMQDR